MNKHYIVYNLKQRKMYQYRNKVRVFTSLRAVEHFIFMQQITLNDIQIITID
jgi:hypothetical protein